MTIETANAGAAGVSGEIRMSTGLATAGGSGDISLETGRASGGNGGSVSIAVGPGDTGDGGDVTVTAGETTAAATKGGDVTIQAGASTDVMGDGGDVFLDAGVSGNVTRNGDVFIGLNAKSTTIGRFDDTAVVDIYGDVGVRTNGTLTVHDSGAALSGHFSATKSFTAVTIAAQSVYVEFIDLPNAALGDVVHCNFDMAIGIIMTSASMSQAAEVQLILHNPTPTAITIPSSTIRCSAWQY